MAQQGALDEGIHHMAQGSCMWLVSDDHSHCRPHFFYFFLFLQLINIRLLTKKKSPSANPMPQGGGRHHLPPPPSVYSLPVSVLNCSAFSFPTSANRNLEIRSEGNKSCIQVDFHTWQRESCCAWVCVRMCVFSVWEREGEGEWERERAWCSHTLKVFFFFL